MGLIPVALADASDATNAAAATAVWGGLMVFWLIFGLLWLVGLVIWIWALVDVIKRDFVKKDDKTIWLIVIIVSFVIGIPLIGAIIYLIWGRKKGTMPGEPSGPSEPTISK
jgi:Sec-independent protein secretion pathway component TatC